MVTFWTRAFRLPDVKTVNTIRRLFNLEEFSLRNLHNKIQNEENNKS